MLKLTKLFCTAFLLLAGFVSASAQDETFDLTADMFYNWNGYGADAASTGAATVDFNVGTELETAAMVAGTSTVDYLIYADLTGCTKMLFEGTAGVQLRVLMNRQESNSGPLQEKNPTIGENGTAELDLTEFSYVHLNAIKTGWSSPTGTITAIKLVKPSDPLAINKEQLKSALSHAKLQSAFAKTEASWEALQQAIADGEAALAAAADATSLDNAKDAIVNAEAALALADGYSELKADMLFSWTGWDATAEKGNQANCSYDLFSSTSQPYGDGSVKAFADLSEYDKLQIVSTGGTPRFLFNRDVDEGQWNEDEAESHLIDNTKGDASSWHAKYFSQEGDVYTVDLAQLVADKGYAHLHAIKTVGGNVVVTGMYLYKTPAKAEDIKISPENGADIYEALIAAELNKKPLNITIELAPGAAYTVSGPLTAYANFEILGNGATIDASGLDHNLIQLNAAEDPAEWAKIDHVSMENATVKGLRKALFYSGCKQYDIDNLTIKNSVVELAADATTIDFTKGSVARNFNVENSTIYAPTATTKAFYSSQSGQKATEADAEAIQSFIFKSTTFYNLAPTKNFFSHRQSNQTWLTYDVQNNIFVNCGKSAQVIKGMNGGQSGKNPTWIVKGNAFNFDGADTSAAEDTGDADEPVQESVAGEVYFTDAAAGDFSGLFWMAADATAPQALGDPRWTLTFKETSALMAEAETLAADKDAVAVGKLIAAIDKAKATADESRLQAAIDQFKEDNKDQEKDETAKVATNGWKKYDGTAAGVCATQFAPAIDTYDGRTKVHLAEVYEGSTEGVNRTGTIIYQDITGLENGTYKVGFYGNAFYTSGRGFDSPMADGAEDVAYVFANEQKEFIVAKIATSTTENSFRTFDVEVTDGTIKLGMGKELAGTNWHTMQIYQLTWFTTAKAVFAQSQQELKTLIAEGETLLADENKTKNREGLEYTIEVSKLLVGTNEYNITEMENALELIKKVIADFKKANAVIPEGKYYLAAMPLIEEDNYMMAAGMSQGTRGVVNGQGLDLNFIYNVDDENYTIDTNIYNNNDHFLGSNLYMDSSAFSWSIEKDAANGHCVYAVFDGVKKYIGVATDNRLELTETPYAWKFFPADEFEQSMKAVGLLAMEFATANSPVDATFLLKDAQFNRNDHRWEAWTVEGSITNLGGGCDESSGNGCAEAYHKAFTLSQKATNVPSGTYGLTAQGFYRQDDNAEEDAPYFFLNDAQKEVPVRTGTENSMTEAGKAFEAGNYTADMILVYVGEDGKLTAGISNGENTHQWVIWDNFVLTYYGPSDEVEYVTAIGEVKTAGQKTADGIYTLAGQRVEKAQRGLYIVNGKKVVMR